MKKRASFKAIRITRENTDIHFHGADPDEQLIISRSQRVVSTIISPSPEILTLRGSLLIGRLKHLYLMFNRDDYLHRVQIELNDIDHRLIEKYMTSLTDGSFAGFDHIQKAL